MAFGRRLDCPRAGAGTPACQAVLTAAGRLSECRVASALGWARTRRNLEWVQSYGDFSPVGQDELFLLADATTSGRLLVAGEFPGYPVVGELVTRRDDSVTVVLR